MPELESRLESVEGKLKLIISQLESDDSQGLPTSAAQQAEKLKRVRRKVEPDYATMAEQLYFERRKRDEIFQLPTVFGEPAWDMLLDLMMARERGQKLSVTAVTQGAAAAPTTALRYLAILESLGLIERKRDQNDGRRSWLQLTDAGHQKMSAFFDKTSLSVRSTTSMRVLETGQLHLISG